MPVQGNRSNVLFDYAIDESCCAALFAHAVRDVLGRIGNGADAAAREMIGEYVRENPHGDVLELTRKLLDPIGGLTEMALHMLDIPGWERAVRRVERLFFKHLPKNIARGNAKNIRIFFERLQQYGIVRLEKAYSKLV